jgi:hypothetical protein
VTEALIYLVARRCLAILPGVRKRVSAYSQFAGELGSGRSRVR